MLALVPLRPLPPLTKATRSHTGEVPPPLEPFALAAAGAMLPLQLRLVQAAVLRDCTTAAARCWTELSGIVLETNGELAACCMRMVDSGAMLEAAHSLEVPGA